MPITSPCMKCKRVGGSGCPCPAAADLIYEGTDIAIELESMVGKKTYAKIAEEVLDKLVGKRLANSVINGGNSGYEPIGLIPPAPQDRCITHTEVNDPWVGKTPEEILDLLKGMLYNDYRVPSYILAGLAFRERVMGDWGNVKDHNTDGDGST